MKIVVTVLIYIAIAIVTACIVSRCNDGKHKFVSAFLGVIFPITWVVGIVGGVIYAVKECNKSKDAVKED